VELVVEGVAEVGERSLLGAEAFPVAIRENLLAYLRDGEEDNGDDDDNRRDWHHDRHDQNRIILRNVIPSELRR